jgi:small-conductance mechanosensitive channel
LFQFAKLFVLALILPLISTQLFAAETVKLGDHQIFKVQFGIGAFTAAERATSIEARISNIAKDRRVDVAKLSIEEFENSTNIMLADRVIVTITDRDAKAISLSRQNLGKDIRANIIKSVKEFRKLNSWRQYGFSAAYAILSTAILLFLLKFISNLFPATLLFVQNWSLKNIPSIKLQSYELLPSSRIVDLTILLVKGLKIFTVLFLLYLYVPLIFSFFPYTSGWADQIFGYVTNPLKSIVKVVVDYIPNLFFVGVILILTNYFLKFLHFLFHEIEKGALRFSGFYSDWAMPTYKLVRFLVFAFALIVIFPYLPGSGSPAFQGVSVFLGILFSLGSTSAIGNIVGGVVLTYMRPFKIGDQVKIGETVGGVVEKNLLVTRIRTPKNVDITVPNAMVLSNHLVNYSASAETQGLLLHTTVTIGYDVDWRRVQDSLIRAASRVEGFKMEPKPFVLQTSLDDFYVAYEINAYTEIPNKMAALYSELHKNIQEEFKTAGIEIMSPHFSAIRDGSQVNIPSEESETKYINPIRVSSTEG